ncbi:BglG family transcription antiterminator [Facklamia miroungae]|uniref:Activator of the mannose operon, transcriptional antiterminator n=1 Tax=Facklamia miroungae TaxID=120956 RepID=A0A1G7U9A8_9LACT|nr:BglG family transcription antiterminator [Facklamia miroungae]NKZ30017.1 BglG family transcription antiterminator [Facklamia miroungae]SDG44192.1 activator of the mannose operon, transcriptional antiterminator [Facklamia miroungae]
MRERQKLLLRDLLQTTVPLNTQEMAEKFACSERTIRNDLKVLEKWLRANSQAEVVLKRQPGVGTYLEADQAVKERLLGIFEDYQTEFEWQSENRQNKILFQLLMNQQVVTIDELSEQLYESKNTIRHDLKTMQRAIQPQQLDLSIEPRIGIQITGDERNKRKVLAQLVKKYTKNQDKEVYLAEFFQKSDLPKIKESIASVDAALLDQEASNTLNNIIIHLLFMVERIKKHATLELTATEKKLIAGTEAYAKSEQIAAELSNKLSIAFPKDEIGYLALHIASLQMNQYSGAKDSRNKIIQPVEKIIDLLIKNVSEILAVDLSKDLYLRKNLRLHLEAAIVRVISNFHIQNPLLKEIKYTYAYLFLIIQFILEDYAETNDIIFPEEEIAYLTIHFKAALERLNEHKQEYQTIITCDYGIGVSSLLKAKINRSFPDLKIVALLSEEELKDYPLKEAIDLVISTKEIKDLNLPQVVVSPMMETKDMKKLQSFVQQKETKQQTALFDLHDYTNTFLIEPQLEVSTKEACLSFMCEQMEKKGYISPHYKNSVFDREESSSTLIAPLVAIPHGNVKHVLKSGIFIVTLKEPLEWGKGKAQLILLLALHKKDLGLVQTKGIFTVLHELTEQPKRLTQLLEKKTQLEIMKALSTTKESL